MLGWWLRVFDSSQELSIPEGGSARALYFDEVLMVLAYLDHDA